MPIYELNDSYVFPNPEEATEEGIIAFGGDLSVGRLVEAYRSGIFPWYEDESPGILWWSPDPRMILYPDDFKVAKSLRQTIRRHTFELRIDTAFSSVIEACSTVPREDQDGTWITDEMKAAYIQLFEEGIAHSVECWQDDVLVGGLYGLSLGKLFFGESMFHHVSNASKVAFYYLSRLAKHLNFSFIDCQMHTDHLASLGAKEMSRHDYLTLIKENRPFETVQGNWSEYVQCVE